MTPLPLNHVARNPCVILAWHETLSRPHLYVRGLHTITCWPICSPLAVLARLRCYAQTDLYLHLSLNLARSAVAVFARSLLPFRFDIQTDRDRVKQCLASFAKDSLSAGPSGVPYLFLHFPEGDTVNRETLASSLEFAKREVWLCVRICFLATLSLLLLFLHEV